VPRHRSPLVDGLTGRLLQLCSATDLDAQTTDHAERIFRELVVPWSRVEAFSANPNGGWVSEISDDNTPIEFSVTLSPIGSEVRVLFEPQGDAPTLASHRQAALLMHEELARAHGADLSRFRQVQDLFVPQDMRGPFALWSAVVFANGREPSFKAYFNPQARGPGRAVMLVEEGLRRLGLRRAWRHLAATLARRGPHRDELKYFALDLSASEQARVKVYVRHHDATPEDLQIAATAAPGSNRGEAEDFARAMGGGARRFKERATFTCAAFVGGDDDRPSATTQYVPVCAYALDDLEVEQRVSSYLLAQQMDSAPYRRLLASFANRPLNAGVGMQSWVAFRRYRGVPRLTVYLGSETRRVFAPGAVPADTRDHISFDSVDEVLDCVAQYPLALHPLLHDLESRPDARALIWLAAINTIDLLETATEFPETSLTSWLAANRDVANGLSAPLQACTHLFMDALGEFRASPDRLEALAAEAAAEHVLHTFAHALNARLGNLEAANDGSRPSGGLVVAASRMAQLNAGGERGLPSVVRGALGIHRRLWSALDRLAEAAAT
jgi:DMATS type aromatic prenyltransferase